MDRCPTKSSYLQGCLCEIWYPYGCGTKCRNMFKNWLKQSEEVSKLHYEIEKLKKGEINEI